MIYLTFTLLLFIPAFIASPFHHHLQRRDVTTVYQPTTIYQTVVASTLEGAYRKTRKVYKHRHEVIKQDRQVFEDELEQLSQQLDPYREYTPGQAARYRQDVEEEYDPDEELILREVDFDIYIVDVEEYVGTTIKGAGKAAFTLLNDTIINGHELATTTL
ncbi:40S ribosomal protein S12 [Mucor velutinosus]|uniref:40S ribosomal protein S12 n=1 Tax=Mucor velutinosus TaxID=708070 RepID=A0AAN7I4K4_9FUNG|nr:40S ribosomal protein S12 [Mucor velutinosus]